MRVGERTGELLEEVTWLDGSSDRTLVEGRVVVAYLVHSSIARFSKAVHSMSTLTWFSTPTLTLQCLGPWLLP
jgi:hypothetical protein